jgi:hypothetical protein
MDKSSKHNATGKEYNTKLHYFMDEILRTDKSTAM